YSACENDAIDLNRNTDIEIIKSVEKPSFGCIFAEGENKLSCISRISENLITYFVLKFGYISIYTGDCNNCKFKNSLEVFKKNLNKAKEILKALDISSESIKVSQAKLRKPFEPNLGIPRRSIFKVKENLLKRDFLIELVKENIKNRACYDGTINLSINDNCDFCSICESVCPKGAIIIEKDQTAKIYFNPSLCSACKNCIDACPKNAILEEKAFVDDLIPKALKLFEKPKKICSCGNVYYTDAEICPECKIKNKKKEELLSYVKDLF
ncbi:MAG TPA: 4Fe-4S dicluster domain-containing protein, partial [Desulfurella acetivorans]|nr:4Fe-4S dicluster domain-containing protein [Desulfurella acetivorans]